MTVEVSKYIATILVKVHSWEDKQLEMAPQTSTISGIHCQEGIQKLWDGEHNNT